MSCARRYVSHDMQHFKSSVNCSSNIPLVEKVSNCVYDKDGQDHIIDHSLNIRPPLISTGCMSGHSYDQFPGLQLRFPISDKNLSPHFIHDYITDICLISVQLFQLKNCT